MDNLVDHDEPKQDRIDGELIGGPADGMRVRVSSRAQYVEIPVASSQHYKLKSVLYCRSSDPRKFEYVPNR